MSLNDSNNRIDVTLLPGSVSRLAGGLYTSVRRLSESLNALDQLNVRVIGNQDAHSAEDLHAWQTPPQLLSSNGLWKLAGELGTQLDSLQPDIVHSHFIWSYASLASARWTSRRPASSRHMISPRGMLDPWAVKHSKLKKKIAAWMFESKHLRTAACIHALCDSEADSIRKFGLTNPICIIPNGIDLPPESVLGRDERDLANSNTKKTMLFIGRIHEKKGIVPLLKAWSAASQSLDGWRLHIAGWDDGGHLEIVKQTIQELGLGDSAKVIGSLYGDDKVAALRAADAFILPSFSEGLPMSILEAWAYRLPVLMTRECNLPIGFESKCAVEITNEPGQLAEQLTAFTKRTTDDLHAMGKSGLELVEGNFQWSAIASQMAEVYAWTLGYRDRPQCVVL